jgi:hypothetical protein
MKNIMVVASLFIFFLSSAEGHLLQASDEIKTIINSQLLVESESIQYPEENGNILFSDTVEEENRIRTRAPIASAPVTPLNQIFNKPVLLFISFFTNATVYTETIPELSFQLRAPPQ